MITREIEREKSAAYKIATTKKEFEVAITIILDTINKLCERGLKPTLEDIVAKNSGDYGKNTVLKVFEFLQERYENKYFEYLQKLTLNPQSKLYQNLQRHLNKGNEGINQSKPTVIKPKKVKNINPFFSKPLEERWVIIRKMHQKSMPNKVIAKKLRISEDTVRKYLKQSDLLGNADFTVVREPVGTRVVSIMEEDSELVKTVASLLVEGLSQGQIATKLDKPLNLIRRCARHIEKVLSVEELEIAKSNALRNLNQHSISPRTEEEIAMVTTQAILLYKDGFSDYMISKLLGIHVDTARNYIKQVETILPGFVKQLKRPDCALRSPYKISKNLADANIARARSRGFNVD